MTSQMMSPFPAVPEHLQERTGEDSAALNAQLVQFMTEGSFVHSSDVRIAPPPAGESPIAALRAKLPAPGIATEKHVLWVYTNIDPQVLC